MPCIAEISSYVFCGPWWRTFLENIVKQCHKPPILEWFIPPIYDDLGDDLLLFCPQYEGFRNTYHPNFDHDFCIETHGDDWGSLMT